MNKYRICVKTKTGERFIAIISATNHHVAIARARREYKLERKIIVAHPVAE